MEIRQEQKMEQHLALTQEMLTSLTILQLSGTDLLEYVKEEALSNPALDSDQVMKSVDGITAQLTPERITPYLDRNLGGSAGSATDPDTQAQWASPQTFREFLEEQLQWLQLSPPVLALARDIVDSLDDHGYLGAADEAALSNRPGYGEALRVIQDLEPAGIGARSLAESLILQLRRRGMADSTMETILTEDLTSLAQGEFAELDDKYPGVDFVALLALIRTLDPRPAAGFSDGSQVVYVLPDLTFTVSGKDLQVSLNRQMIPEISISSDYLRLLEQMEGEEKLLSRQYVRRLTGIIEAIEKRNATLLRIGQGIAHHQRDYLLGESGQPRSLTMSELARYLELNVSTISRAVRGKHVQFRHEVLPLHVFFTRGGPRDGSNSSRTQIQAIIQAMIAEEDAGRPLSDQRIVERLKERGITISRRTVAKYRSQLNLAGRHLRHPKK